MAFLNVSGGFGAAWAYGVGWEGWFFGGSGPDALVGNAARNWMFGADGDDSITGGLGGDLLIGGEGADHFIYLTPDDSKAFETDTIFDFEQGLDKIDVSALVQQYGLTWTGQTPTSHGGWFMKLAGLTYIFLDTGGTPESPAMVIRVNGRYDLTAADFIGFNVPPVLSGDLNGQPILEAGSYQIVSPTDLGWVDPDDVAADILFTVSDFVNGKVQVNGIDDNTFTGSELQAGLVTFIHDGSETTTASFKVVVEDENEDGSDAFAGDPPGATGTFTFNVTPVNDPPVSTDDSVQINEDTPYFLQTTDFGTYSDPENDPMSHVKITAVETNGDLEWFDGVNWVDVTAGQEITVADLTGNKLRFTPDLNENDQNPGPNPPYATLQYQVKDGALWSVASYTLSIGVTPVNDPPVLTGDLTGTVDEGKSAVIVNPADLGYSDVDDGDTGVLFGVQAFVNGKVQVNGVDATSFTVADLTGGKVTFLHDGSETATASFDVAVEDGNEDASAPTYSTFNFTVNPENDNIPFFIDPPDWTAGYMENSGAIEIFDAEADDLDLPADTLTFSFGVPVPTDGALNPLFAIDPATGKVSVTAAGAAYLDWDNPNVPKQYQLEVIVTDAAYPGQPTHFDSQKYLLVNLQNDTKDDNPTATDDSVTINEDVPGYKLQVAAVIGADDTATSDFGDYEDGQGHALSKVRITTLETNGDLELFDGVVTYNDVTLNQEITLADLTGKGLFYTPNKDFNGADKIGFKVIDANGHVSDLEYFLTFNVDPVNDAPALTGDLMGAANEGATYTVTYDDLKDSSKDLGYTDVDDLDPAMTFKVTNPLNGKTQVGGVDATSFTVQDLIDGKVTFVHDGSETATGEFDVEVFDDDNAGSGASKFTIDITPVNDNPTAVADAIYVSANTAVAIPLTWLLENDTDPENDALTITGVTITGTDYFTVDPALAAPNLTFTTGANEGLSTTLEYTIDDGNGGTSKATVTVYIQPGDGDPDVVSPGSPYQGAYYNAQGGGDTYTGGNKHDIILGGGGNDTLGGGDGVDEIRGGQGNDRIDLADGVNPAGDDLYFENANNNGVDTIFNYTFVPDPADDDRLHLLANTTTAPTVAGAAAVKAVVDVSGGLTGGNFNLGTLVTDTNTVDVVVLNNGNTTDANLGTNTDGTDLLAYLGVAADAADGIQMDGNNHALYLVAFDNGNAYLYRADSGGGSNIAVASEITLMGIFDTVSQATSLGNFYMY